MRSDVVFRHWFPIVTFCPVNRLPDLIYVSVRVKNGQFIDLYAVRKQVRKIAAWRLAYMEAIAFDILEKFPRSYVTVRLAFSRHEITVYNEDLQNEA